jgi:hypothetical protein
MLKVFIAVTSCCLLGKFLNWRVGAGKNRVPVFVYPSVVGREIQRRRAE